jgi:hypothetical protein
VPETSAEEVLLEISADSTKKTVTEAKAIWGIVVTSCHRAKSKPGRHLLD